MQVKDYLQGVDGLPVSNVLVYEAEDLKAIVRPSGTEPKVKVYLFARAANQAASAALLDSLESELSAAIRDKVHYDIVYTDVDSTAEEAAAAGHGVCQDHAHLFLAAARLSGVPSRYVSGYIMPGDTQHAASHAWVDAWFAETGWVSVDVTHAQFAADWHCRIAVGRDYESAGPVRGVRTGVHDCVVEERRHVEHEQHGKLSERGAERTRQRPPDAHPCG